MDDVADVDKPTLLYLTPERIVDRAFRAELKRIRPRARALRRRRGALHLAVGPRLPPRVPRPRRGGARRRRALAAGADRDRAAAGARRHPRAPDDAEGARRRRRHGASEPALQRHPRRAPSTRSSRSSPSWSRACPAPASSTSRRSRRPTSSAPSCATRASTSASTTAGCRRRSARACRTRSWAASPAARS